MSDTKVCSVCGIEKHYLEYNINGRGGYRNKKCKTCLSNYFRKKTNQELPAETKVCKACNIERPITFFWKSSNGNRQNRCKVCFKNKQFIQQRVAPEDKEYKKSKYHKTYDEIFRLDAPTANDYKLTYSFLESCGYDISKDIHKQFCEKYNLKYKKKNSFTEPTYLFDGSLNPNRKNKK
jgi:hypothetical protein